MAVATDSTPALARPLLHPAAVDRRAVSRDGWARARALAARLGGELRDHLAEGMRRAWRAARAAATPAGRAELPPEPLLSRTAPATLSQGQRRFVPAMGFAMTAEAGNPAPGSSPAARRKFRLGGAQAEGLDLPPAPLPSLRTALAHRAAVFGPVVAVTATTASSAEESRPGSSPPPRPERRLPDRPAP